MPFTLQKSRIQKILIKNLLTNSDKALLYFPWGRVLIIVLVSYILKIWKQCLSSPNMPLSIPVSVMSEICFKRVVP